MNQRIVQIRALDKKTKDLKSNLNIISHNSSWINTVREAIGMTAIQLAKRLGITQPRISKMEMNEENLKISTMKKIAQALNCDFVYYFKPQNSFQGIVENQARKKAIEILQQVNLNMALENQSIVTDEVIEDLVQELIYKDTKKIWD